MLRLRTGPAATDGEAAPIRTRLLYPPDKKPPFDPDERSVLWSERWAKGLIDFEARPAESLPPYG